MARRENQGLHIALISLVIVTVLLLVLTYFFWSRSSDLERQLAGLKDQNTQLNSEKGTAVLHAENLKKWIGGHTADVDIAVVEEAYNKDMLTYAGSLEEVQRTYTELPKHLNSKMQNLNDLLSKSSAEVRSLKDELAQTKDQLGKKLNLALEAQAEAVQQLQQVTNKGQEERQRINADRTRIARDLDKTKQSLASTVATKDGEIGDLKRQNQDLTIIAGERQETIKNLTNESFETPDGKIKWVNPTTRTVFVNLGGDDGLRPQVTFAVYGMDVNNLAKETPKGKIEIIRVLNSRMAEGRIIDDSIDDPIISGDAIYTPVWNAGKAMRFALLGKMDLNGDGRDDRERVKSLIRLSNGKIDAEDVSGEMKGRLTRDTRYLIVGESLIDVAADDGKAGAAAGGGNSYKVRTEMLNEAARLGVEEITLSKISGFLRYNGEKQILPLGRRARAEDFRAKPEPGARRSSSARLFKERKPPASRRSTKSISY